MQKGESAIDLGPLFRQFRLDKNFKLNETAEGIVSTQFLRRFEKGENDIASTKLFDLLIRINVSVDEFMEEYHRHSEKYTLEKLEEMIDAIRINKDERKLDFLLEKLAGEQSILSSSDKKFAGYLKIILLIIGNREFNRDFTVDAAPIISYLETTESWGKYEFFLGTNTIQALENHQLTILWKQAFSRKIKSVSIRRYSNDFFLHVCLNLLRGSEVELTKQLLEEYKLCQQPEKNMQNLSYAILVEVLEGIILILENEPEGEKQVDVIIDFFNNQIEYTEYAGRLEAVVDRIVQVNRQKDSKF